MSAHDVERANRASRRGGRTGAPATGATRSAPRGGGTGTSAAPTSVISLDHPAALDVARVGGGAADLAAARAAGLPVAPGVVLTTEWRTQDRATADQVWRIVSHDGARALLVRSGADDHERTWAHDDATRAPAIITRDADTMLAAAADLRIDDRTAPVLLQAHVASRWQGHLVTRMGDDARRRGLVAVTRSTASGIDSIAELDAHGRVRDLVAAEHRPGPSAAMLARLVRLADRVAVMFHGHRDIEWMSDADGRLQLLQIRAAAGRCPMPSARPLGSRPRDEVRRAPHDVGHRDHDVARAPMVPRPWSVDEPAA